MLAYMPPAKSDIHITPNRVFDLIKEYWDYNKKDFFDPCPVNPRWDGLKISWEKLNFVNPPYSELENFVLKAIDESLNDKNTIMLLPSKTEQFWFHEIIKKRYEIKWIRRRLKFKNNKWSATQPHFLVRISGDKN